MAPKSGNSKTTINEISLEIPIQNYFDGLVTEFQQIREIWLLGARANNCARDDSDWDILLFADSTVLQSLQENEKYKQSSQNLKVDLLVLYNKDNFEAPWLSLNWRRTRQILKKGTLSEWEFKPNRNNSNIGHYKGTHAPTLSSKRCKMYRIWTREKGWIIRNDENN